MNTVQERERYLCIIKTDNYYPDFIKLCDSFKIANPDDLFDEILKYVFLAEFTGIYEIGFDQYAMDAEVWNELNKAVDDFIDNNEMALMDDLEGFLPHLTTMKRRSENFWFNSDISACKRYITIALRYYDETVRDHSN